MEPRRIPKGGAFVPPLVSLHALREAHGYTLEQVANGVATITGKKAPSVGAISGIELGHRKGSDEILDALVTFYGLDGTPHVYPRPRLLPSPARNVA